MSHSTNNIVYKLKSYLISLIHFLDEIIKKPRIIISYCSFKIWSRLLDWNCQWQQRELPTWTWLSLFHMTKKIWNSHYRHDRQVQGLYTSEYLPRKKDKDRCTWNWGCLAKSVWGEGNHLKGRNLRVLVSVCEFPWITGMQLDVIFFNITRSLTIYFIHTINAATVDFAVSEQTYHWLVIKWEALHWPQCICCTT